jgi:hypothetical protein
MSSMDLREALELLELSDAPGALTIESLRKQYLRLALRTHPDKNPGVEGAAERFQRLGAAHALLLASVERQATVQSEQHRAAALLDLLLRTLQGEDVEEQLRALGEHRPPAAFGVDLTLPFDGRVPPLEAGEGGWVDEGPPDVEQLLQEAFQQEGLTKEGDPAGGYAIPPGTEVFF